MKPEMWYETEVAKDGALTTKKALEGGNCSNREIIFCLKI